MAQLDDFRRGLYPILLSGDLDAFRSYLTQWEDVIGDTTELAETSPAHLKRTMAALLRRPQQFNLPPWPRQPAAATAAEPVTPLPPGAALEAPAPPLAEPAAPEAEPAAPSDSGRPAETAAAGALPPLPDPGPAPPEPAAGNAVPARAVYQIDMLTGEFMPASETPPPAKELPDPPAPRKPRRRRLPKHMVQLTLWEDD